MEKDLLLILGSALKTKRPWKNPAYFPVLFCFIFIPLLLFASCRPRPTVLQKAGEVIIDALGRPYTLSETPLRIVSLNPSVTEILFAIGAGDRIVGVTSYCDYPPAALEKTSVGGFSGATMSLEQIRALNPDLVILSAFMHVRIVALLDELGIPSFAVEPGDFSEVYEVITLIGEITGFSEGAAGVVDGMKGRIDALNELLMGRPRPQVFWLLSEEPLMSVGRGTIVSEAISLAGGINIFDDVREEWPLVSPEQVLMRRPDWIISDDQAGEMSFLRQMNAASFWQSIPAVREGRTAFIDPGLIYRFGPRLAEGVEQIAWILHGITAAAVDSSGPEP